MFVLYLNLAGKPGLIAEVKKASPSKGVIQPNFDPVRIAAAYEAGGAACLSVLTDEKFFQGSFDNLAKIKAAGVSCPLLCKEFIVEAYQIFKARVSGADAVLLIAAVLPNQVRACSEGFVARGVWCRNIACCVASATSLRYVCLATSRTLSGQVRACQMMYSSRCGVGLRSGEQGGLQLAKIAACGSKQVEYGFVAEEPWQ
jgi:hypothetical protein